MLKIISTRWFSFHAGFSQQFGRWCIVAYGPKHEERSKYGLLRWEWRLEWLGRFRVHRYWWPYNPA